MTYEALMIECNVLLFHCYSTLAFMTAAPLSLCTFAAVVGGDPAPQYCPPALLLSHS
ncbi:hypothetical protein K461DRAFT_283191 [Myriangium duriaei CBS 260.36]|uniref:Uncharacterized protein n=1 Tax=Myriangium duriaei CBS 260.36 TaxID=1168546 RepID=A0A9P4ITA2_9PEZI|nr:hypothetical protein K461DRAFT_283191 [Myriangium duriaei CBS 260.36]